jgi:thioredoxin reductase (NADPH)
LTKDLIIIGSGCAGLAAAIYAQRFDLKTLVIGELPGGTITKTHLVENYPGFTHLSGFELANEILKHAKNLNTEILLGKVTKVTKIKSNFKVSTIDQSFETRSLILATGTKHRRLNVPGEKKFENKGVSFCATCDAPFFREKTVAVIGGSDSAVKESLILAEHAAKIFLIYRGVKLKAEPINLHQLKKKSKIELVFKSEIAEIVGNERVEKIVLQSGKEIKLDGIFVEIGRIPQTELARDLGVTLDERGEIKINRDSKTSLTGVFAAGDCTDSSWKQAITGVAEGAKAAHSAFEFLNSFN